MKEVWKHIPGFANYQVSNTGLVKSIERVIFFGKNKSSSRRVNEKILSPGRDKDGYLQVGLSVDGKVTHKKIHRLVLLSFIGKSDLGVNHKDGDKQNNTLNNIEYSTHSDNHKHARDILNKLTGESHWNFKGYKTNENLFYFRRFLSFGISKRQISTILGIPYKTLQSFTYAN
jgi:hypothetical protein